MTPVAGDPFALAERPLIAYKAVGGRSLRLQFGSLVRLYMSRNHAHGGSQGIVLNQGIDRRCRRAGVSQQLLHCPDVL